MHQDHIGAWPPAADECQTGAGIAVHNEGGRSQGGDKLQGTQDSMKFGSNRGVVWGETPSLAQVKGREVHSRGCLESVGATGAIK